MGSMKKSKNLIVSFDSEARKEYLTGFQKRKKQRKKYSEKMKKKQEKEELKAIRKMKSEQRREILKSFENIQDQEIDENQQHSEQTEFNQGMVSVTVTELDLQN